MNWDSDDLNISIGESEKESQLVAGAIINLLLSLYLSLFFLVWKAKQIVIPLKLKQTPHKKQFFSQETNKKKTTLP
jgi:hypothetical protein